jgi:L-threonylcarbamoyladenylate synthase
VARGSAVRGAAAAALSMEEAAARVAAGGLVAYPTETVWGLGADARSEAAVARLRRFKGREADQPMAVLVAGPEALAALGAALGPAAQRLAARFWPGPLTLILPCTARLATGVARADGAVGFRCSPHPVARALAEALAARGVCPVTATSLNPTGAPPARTRAEAEALCAAPGGSGPARMDGEAPSGLPALVAGEEAGGAEPSSVVDATGEAPLLLREGALAAALLAEAAGTRLAS